jgi:hypothetical protein
MKQEEVLKIIEQAARDGRTELDLSDNKLTSVPAEEVRRSRRGRMAGNDFSVLNSWMEIRDWLKNATDSGCKQVPYGNRFIPGNLRAGTGAE